jgi:hypothetical protein
MQGPMQCSEIVCPLLEAEKLILPPSVASPFTLMLPSEAETFTEAVPEPDSAEALEKLELDAVPPSLLPSEAEAFTEAVADFDPAEALEKLEADAVPPPLTLTWLDDETDTLSARAGCAQNKMIE